MSVTQAFASYKIAHRLYHIAAEAFLQLDKEGAPQAMLDAAHKVFWYAQNNLILSKIALTRAFQLS